MTERLPPRLAVWLLKHFGSGADNEALLGDLAEQYVEKRSPMWYWRQAIGAILVRGDRSRNNIMRHGFRIVLWASAGFLVSAGWGFYFAAANKAIPIGLISYALASLSQPAAGVVAHFYPHYLLGLRAVAIANALTYAFVGVIVETIRRRSQTFRTSN